MKMIVLIKEIASMTGLFILLSCTTTKHSAVTKPSIGKMDSISVKNLIYEKVTNRSCADVLYLLSQKMVPLEDTIYGFRFDSNQVQYLKYLDGGWLYPIEYVKSGLSGIGWGELELNYLTELVRSTLRNNTNIMDTVHFGCLKNLTQNDMRYIFGMPSMISGTDLEQVWFYSFNFGLECPNKFPFPGMGRQYKYGNCDYYRIHFDSLGKVNAFYTFLGGGNIENNPYYFPKKE